ncbi:hypothetical protein HDU96_006169 [Phlyctochytrium bullatum]|nr:hypothetical protein HDU96_006169 [Phlyctochytrium bullatum]
MIPPLLLLLLALQPLLHAHPDPHPPPHIPRDVLPPQPDGTPCEGTASLCGPPNDRGHDTVQQCVDGKLVTIAVCDGEGATTCRMGGGGTPYCSGCAEMEEGRKEATEHPLQQEHQSPLPTAVPPVNPERYDAYTRTPTPDAPFCHDGDLRCGPLDDQHRGTILQCVSQVFVRLATCDRPGLSACIMAPAPAADATPRLFRRDDLPPPRLGATVPTCVRGRGAVGSYMRLDGTFNVADKELELLAVAAAPPAVDPAAAPPHSSPAPSTPDPAPAAAPTPRPDPPSPTLESSTTSAAPPPASPTNRPSPTSASDATKPTAAPEPQQKQARPVVAPDAVGEADAPYAELGLTRCQYDIIMKITSVFETSSQTPRYDLCSNINDGQGLTAGFMQFTTSSGSLLRVIEAYLPHATLSPAPLASHLPALRHAATLGNQGHTTGPGHTTGLDTLCDAWRDAATRDLPAFAAAQRRVQQEMYLRPAGNVAAALGLRSAAGIGVVFDTAIQLGVGGAEGVAEDARRSGRCPVGGGSDERVCLEAVLDARERKVVAMGGAYGGTVYRVRSYRHVVGGGNLGFVGGTVEALENGGGRMTVTCEA